MKAATVEHNGSTATLMLSSPYVGGPQRLVLQMESPSGYEMIDLEFNLPTPTLEARALVEANRKEFFRRMNG